MKRYWRYTWIEDGLIKYSQNSNPCRELVAVNILEKHPKVQSVHFYPAELLTEENFQSITR